MIESFTDFLQRKRLPAEAKPEEVYDQHVDAIMHHLGEVHRLTQDKSLLHKALHKLGEDSSHVNELHDHIGKLIKKFGG